MKHNLLGKENKTWLAEIKSKVRNVQLKAVVKVIQKCFCFIGGLALIS